MCSSAQKFCGPPGPYSLVLGLGGRAIVETELRALHTQARPLLQPLELASSLILYPELRSIDLYYFVKNDKLEINHLLCTLEVNVKWESLIFYFYTYFFLK